MAKKSKEQKWQEECMECTWDIFKERSAKVLENIVSELVTRKPVCGGKQEEISYDVPNGYFETKVAAMHEGIVNEMYGIGVYTDEMGKFVEQLTDAFYKILPQLVAIAAIAE